MTGSHSTDAEDLKDKVGRIEFEINTRVTEVIRLREELITLADEIFALKTYNPNVMIVGGRLRNIVPEELSRVLNELTQAIKALHTFRGEL